MDGRRSFLKAALVAMGTALVAPLRMLFGATPPKAQAARARLSLSEEKILRAFYEEGWNKGNTAVLDGHPAIAEKCRKQFDRYRGAFPDLGFDVVSIQKTGDEFQVKWTAQGTHRGALDGHAATGRRAGLQGLTKFGIADGKIVSASPEFDQAALQKQLGVRAPG